MADGFRKGADLHVTTACGVLGLTPDVERYGPYGIADEDRQVGKVLNFSIVYGGGMPTVMEQLGVSAPEALAILRRFHNTWPGIGWHTKKKPAAPGTLIHSILQRIDERGYITTLYGRHLHPKAMHAALNNLCQGCAADLMKWAMVRVDAGLKAGKYQSHIVCMVHDDLALDVKRIELDWLAGLIPEWMTDPRIEAVVPIRPSCEVSYTNWADKAPWEATE